MKFLCLLIFFISSLYSQEKFLSLKVANFEKHSWWSFHNHYGLNIKNPYLKFSFKDKYKKTSISIDSFVSSDRLILGESFLKRDINDFLEIKVGRYYRDFSKYLNNDISSGSMLISNNSQPMPKIGLLGKYHIKRSDNIFLDYGISHGTFDKNNIYNEAPNLHGKFLYLTKVFDNVEFSVGFVHQAMWGGSTYINGKFPASFQDFLKVLISADGNIKNGQPHANALGNHLGIWDFLFLKKYKENKFKFYYQHLFEDTSGLRFANRFDGLWGFEYENQSTQTNLVIEFINTINQDRDPPYVNESYYNNAEYNLGWSYKGYVIGNPFIDNINPNPSKIVHVGLQSFSKNKYYYKAKISKKTHIKSDIYYDIKIGRELKNILFSVCTWGGTVKNYGFEIDYRL